MGRVAGMGAGMALLAMAAQPVWGQGVPGLSAAGYSGLAVTPDARLLRWGTMGLAYDNAVLGATPGSRHGTDGHNLVAGFGLLPNLEITGRVASSTLDENCYVTNCGVRDLSFNFKAGLALDKAGQWKVAGGITDLGGAATLFRSYYGVLSYTDGKLPFGEFDASAGWARRDQARANRPAAPLDGPFASAAYRPWSWLQGSVEYVDGGSWAGARLYAPSSWLPEGWSAHLGANVRLHGDDRTPRNWFSVGLTVPLYKVPTVRPAPTSTGAPGALVAPAAPDPAAPSPNAREFSPAGLPPSAPLQAVAQSLAAPSSQDVQAGARSIDDERLSRLADALVAKGFEDVDVGRLANGAVAVRINNATYNVNTADALGVALGVVARELATDRADYRLVLTQRQLAVVGASGRADCLAQWIVRETPSCTAVGLHAPGQDEVDALVAGAAWAVEGRAPSWHTARVSVQPVLRSALATEYGAFDYSLGLRATLQQPLWSGAYAEVSHIAPMAESDDYRDGGVFARSRIENDTDRILVHQSLRLPLERLFADREAASRRGASALTAHVAAGRFDSNYRGLFGELRWEPGAGDHRLALEGGRFERTTYYDQVLPIDTRSLLGSYRYAYRPTNTYFEASAGQFMYGDVGVRLGVKQWFHDVAVSMYWRRSKFDWANASRDVAGIEISIPFTPRKDMSPTHHIQVTGVPRWSYAVETVVGEGRNSVGVGVAQGVRPNAATLDATFNSDRAGLAYFQANLPRIRSAAAQ